MERQAVELQIGGQKYRVVSSVDEVHLHRLAGAVSKKLKEIAPPGGGAPPQAMLLAAIALAHEVEAERGRRESLEERTRELLGRMLVRIDDALEGPDNREGTESD